MNYNLNTGEKLKIEDLFLSNYDMDSMIKDIFKHAYSTSYPYEDLVEQGVINEKKFTESEMMWGVSYRSVDENKLRKFINAFNYTEDIKFGFTPSQVFITLLENVGTKYLSADNCAIYDRFKDKSIFEDTSIGEKGINCFNDISIGNTIRIHKNEDKDKARYDYYILNYATENEKEVNNIITKLDNKIEEYIKEQTSTLKNNEKLLFSGVFTISQCTAKNNTIDIVDETKDFYFCYATPSIWILKQDDKVFNHKHLVTNYWLDGWEYEQPKIEFGDTNFTQDGIEITDNFDKKIQLIRTNSYDYEKCFFGFIDSQGNILRDAKDFLCYVLKEPEDWENVVRRVYAEKYEKDTFAQLYCEKELGDIQLKAQYYDINLEVPEKEYNLKHEVSIVSLNHINKGFEKYITMYYEPW